jgi:hypothetical protein
MTADTATSPFPTLLFHPLPRLGVLADPPATSEGMFSSILHGLLTGFLFPMIPWFFFQDLPLPNFFDAEEPANTADRPRSANEHVIEAVASQPMPSIVFGKRMQVCRWSTKAPTKGQTELMRQMGILFGTVLNLAFGALRFLN